MDKITEVKRKLLSTSVTGWKNAISTAILLIMSVSGVGVFGFILLTTPALQCHAIFFYLSLFWLASEVVLIAYLYCYKNIPRFAREAVVFSLLIANIWFILFIFGLKGCPA